MWIERQRLLARARSTPRVVSISSEHIDINIFLVIPPETANSGNVSSASKLAICYEIKIAQRLQKRYGSDVGGQEQSQRRERNGIRFNNCCFDCEKLFHIAMKHLNIRKVFGPFICKALPVVVLDKNVDETAVLFQNFGWRPESIGC